MRGPIDVTLVTGHEAVAAVHRRAGAQPDNLCGPFWAAILLRAAGIVATADDVAVAAATLLPPPSFDARRSVPPGQPNRDAYTREIPHAHDAEAAGTSVPGLVEAAAQLSRGSHAFVPVRGRAGRPFDGEALLALVGVATEHEERPVWPVLNVRTGRLWGTGLPTSDALAYLLGGDVAGPAPEWDVGHFVHLAGAMRGVEGRAMLLVLDTYPSFGAAGTHLQPVEAVGSALQRGDGREGGCLVFVRTADAPDVERELKEAGFDVGVWDNGTPYEGG